MANWPNTGHNTDKPIIQRERILKAFDFYFSLSLIEQNQCRFPFSSLEKATISLKILRAITKSVQIGYLAKLCHF